MHPLFNRSNSTSKITKTTSNERVSTTTDDSKKIESEQRNIMWRSFGSFDKVPVNSGHDFIMKIFPSSTWCGFCSEFIFGNEGYMCKLCNNYPIHKRCLKKAHKPCTPGFDNKRGSIRGYYPSLSKTEPVTANKPKVRPALRPDGFDSQMSSSVKTLLGFFENGTSDTRFKDNVANTKEEPKLDSSEMRLVKSAETPVSIITDDPVDTAITVSTSIEPASVVYTISQEETTITTTEDQNFKNATDDQVTDDIKPYDEQRDQNRADATTFEMQPQVEGNPISKSQTEEDIEMYSRQKSEDSSRNSSPMQSQLTPDSELEFPKEELQTSSTPTEGASSLTSTTHVENERVASLPLLKEIQPAVKRSASLESPATPSVPNEKYQHDLLELKYQMEKRQLEIEQQKEPEDNDKRIAELKKKLENCQKESDLWSKLSEEVKRLEDLKAEAPKPRANSKSETPVLRRTRSEGGDKMSSSVEQSKVQANKKKPDVAEEKKGYASHISEFARVETRQKSFSVSAPPRAEAALGDSKDNLITQFSYAFARGEKKQAKKKIQKLLGKPATRNVLFNAVDQYGQNILHLCVDNCPEIISMLVEKKMDINKTDLRNMTPLALAATKGDEKVFMELLSLGAKPDQTVFHYFVTHFCSSNCEKILKNLLEKGVDINQPPPSTLTGDKPIHSAVVNSRENKVENLVGSVLMVELLIKYGAKINVKNNKGDAPLHWAVYTDKSRVAKLLLIAGADLKLKGSEGLTPLELANKKPNTNVAQCLRRVNEITQILQPLDFHSEESHDFILKKFIEEEVGETAFKGMTYEILHAMGIKNAANIGVLLSAQEKLKKTETPIVEQKKTNIDVPARESNSNSLEVERWLQILPLGTDVKGKTNDQTDRVAKKRLETRLEQFKLKRKANDTSVPDHNAVFLAVADQLFDSPDSMGEIRTSVANWLRRNKDWKPNASNMTLASYVHSSSWEKYCSQIEKDAWGDGLVLIAISEVYGCKIFVISSVIGSEYAITITPTTQKNTRTVLLSHILDLQFSSLDQMVEDPLFMSLDDFVVDFKDLKLIREVGSGSTGEIFECLWKGVRVAAKRISLSSMPKEEISGFMNEIALLKRLRHPNIVQFMATCIHGGNLYIITEFMNQGNLKALLRSTSLEWSVRLNIATDIAQGMCYLHGLRPKVIHRDLKPSNVLLDKSLNVKICDFGVAKIFQNDQQFLRTVCTTPAWTAPEIFNGEGYDERADVYSFGLVLWELLTGQEPFKEFSDQQIILGVSQGNLRPSIPASVSKEYAELMQDCWSKDVQKRPSFEEILTRLKQINESERETQSDNLRKSSSSEEQKVPVADVPSQLDRKDLPYWQIDFSELSFKQADVIGTGRSAIVYRGSFRGQKVAIKVLKELPEDGSFEKELEVLSRIRTPKLVFFYGACLSPKCCIVTELMDQGTLFDYMQQHQKQFGWKEVIKFAKEISKGIYFLHSWKPPVVHRDIKSSNLLLDKEDSIKICDLGLARFATKSNDLTLRKCKGTPVYMAPEAYFSALEVAEEEKGAKNRGSTDNLSSELKSLLDDIKSKGLDRGWSTKSDVFSFSIVLWELCTRCYYGEYRTPYYSDNKALKYDAAIVIQVAKKGLRPIINPNIPKPLQLLIQKCWSQDPSKRPDFDSALEELDYIQQDYEQNKFAWNKCYVFNTR